MTYADPGPSLPEIIAAMLAGLGALFHVAADVMIELAAWITKYGAALIKSLRDAGGRGRGVGGFRRRGRAAAVAPAETMITTV